MIVLLRLLVCGLAAYRLARALSIDTISEPFRSWVFWQGHAEDADTTVTSRPWAWFYGLVSCPFCCSFWIALALYAAWINWGWSRPFIGGVAVAGVAAQLVGFDRAANRD